MLLILRLFYLIGNCCRNARYQVRDALRMAPLRANVYSPQVPMNSQIKEPSSEVTGPFKNKPCDGFIRQRPDRFVVFP